MLPGGVGEVGSIKGGFSRSSEMAQILGRARIVLQAELGRSRL